MVSIALLPAITYANGTNFDQSTDEMHQESIQQNSMVEANNYSSPLSKMLISGYADANFIDTQNQNSKFTLGHFNPIFAYLYNDLILAAAELELELDSNGETETNLEFANLGLFAHDYITIVAGKFLSPLGYFVQNIHPSWINKLPSKPPGFDGEEAAPEADVGAELRGGFPAGSHLLFNYGLFVANGPQANLEDGEIEDISTEGFNDDSDGSKVVGARLGFLPIPKLEIGVSAAWGKIGLVDSAGTFIEKRGYEVLGADFNYHWKSLNLIGEYIQQQVKSKSESSIPGGKWKAWYLQTSYLFPLNWEPVIRYGAYDTPHADQDRREWAFGINYWFAPSVVAKASYQLSSGSAESTNNDNTLWFQLAYGF